jgi:hypothetical protein
MVEPTKRHPPLDRSTSVPSPPPLSAIAANLARRARVVVVETVRVPNQPNSKIAAGDRDGTETDRLID